MIKTATIETDQISFSISETESGKLKFTMQNEDNSVFISAEFLFEDFEDIVREVRTQFKVQTYISAG